MRRSFFLYVKNYAEERVSRSLFVFDHPIHILSPSSITVLALILPLMSPSLSTVSPSQKFSHLTMSLAWKPLRYMYALCLELLPEYCYHRKFLLLYWTWKSEPLSCKWIALQHHWHMYYISVDLIDSAKFSFVWFNFLNVWFDTMCANTCRRMCSLLWVDRLLTAVWEATMAQFLPSESPFVVWLACTCRRKWFCVNVCGYVAWDNIFSIPANLTVLHCTCTMYVSY